MTVLNFNEAHKRKLITDYNLELRGLLRGEIVKFFNEQIKNKKNKLTVNHIIFEVVKLLSCKAMHLSLEPEYIESELMDELDNIFETIINGILNE